MTHMTGQASWLTLGLLSVGAFFVWWMFWKSNHLTTHHK